MALVFQDGFDKYGGVNSATANVAALMTAGEWTTVTGNMQIVAGLSSTGFAYLNGTSTVATKTLGANYSRLIGGVRFSSPLTTANAGITFADVGTAQCSITINTTGTFSVRTGAINGTALATSTATISANTTHYLEWDITFGASSPYQVWLDGVSIISGTGATRTTANNYANQFLLSNTGVNATATFDDLYLFDTSGTTNNAVLLTSPRIETQFPVSDAAVQFSVGAVILGTTTQRGGSNYNSSANNLYLRPFIPTLNCTVSAIGVMPGATNSSVQLRPVIYTDVSGTPTTLMSAGATVVGTTSGVIQTLPLTTPQALTAGTRYWLGLQNDLAITALYAAQDASLDARWGTATFSSGAPGTAPSTSGGQNAAVIFGVLSTAPSNAYVVSRNPPQGNYSYIYDATIGHEDLYNMPALSVVPSAIYAAVVKANVAKSDAGAKTISIRQKSSTTDSAGGGGTALAPGTSYGWLTSVFERDPNGNIAWTKAALDAAQCGVKVET